jgi:hypothetical protein
MKHLYLKIGKYKVHSELCWCEQITRLQNISIGETFGHIPRDYEMYYPHEADEIYCRCPHPVVKYVNKELEVCLLCGKPLEKRN